MNKPYHILSIIAYDRSGTTFLGKYLNSFDNVVYVGETDRGLNYLHKKEIEKCTCGEDFQNCEVWGYVAEDKSYNNDNLEKVFDHIHNVTGAKIIVDTSKGFDQIKKINEIFGNRHHIFHIVRNPKGIVYSRLKTRKRLVEKGIHPNPKVAKRTGLLMIFDSIEWGLENIWHERFMRKKNNVSKLTYENLRNDLLEKAIPDLRDIGLEGDFQEGKRGHVIFGNISRYKPVSKEIQIDNKWSSGLNSLQKSMVDLLTLPVRIIFGYRFR